MTMLDQLADKTSDGVQGVLWANSRSPSVSVSAHCLISTAETFASCRRQASTPLSD